MLFKLKKFVSYSKSVSIQLYIFLSGNPLPYADVDKSAAYSTSTGFLLSIVKKVLTLFFSH